eukprot:403365791
MVSLVTKFEVNISDLASLMILPDILTLIQQSLLDDRRLLVDLKMKPQVILRNHVTRIYIDNEFDRFELANKLKQFSRCIQDIKLFDIVSEMKFKTNQSKRILYEFLISSKDFLLDSSITQGIYRENCPNIKVLELILKRSKAVFIDTSTLYFITMKRNSLSAYKNVKKLTIVHPHYQCDGDLNKLKMIFPQLESMDLLLSKHNYGSLNSKLDYLFPKIADIEVPTIELNIIAETCVVKHFLSYFNSPNLSTMFPNYKANIKYSFSVGKRCDCGKMTMVFKKNLENIDIYTFDILFENEREW